MTAKSTNETTLSINGFPIQTAINENLEKKVFYVYQVTFSVWCWKRTDGSLIDCLRKHHNGISEDGSCVPYFYHLLCADYLRSGWPCSILLGKTGRVFNIFFRWVHDMNIFFHSLKLTFWMRVKQIDVQSTERMQSFSTQISISYS